MEKRRKETKYYLSKGEKAQCWWGPGGSQGCSHVWPRKSLFGRSLETWAKPATAAQGWLRGCPGVHDDWGEKLFEQDFIIGCQKGSWKSAFSQAEESPAGTSNTILLKVEEAGWPMTYASPAAASPSSKTNDLSCKSVLNFHDLFYSPVPVDWFI